MDQASKPRPNIYVRQTGIPLQSPMSTPKLAEKKMFLVRGTTRIPVTATYTQNSKNSNVSTKVHIPGTKKSPSPPPPVLVQMDTPIAEVKQELPDEDSPGAVANIIESKPLLFDDLQMTEDKPDTLWPEVKKEEPEDELVLHLKSAPDDQMPSTSSAPPPSQKRTRKAAPRYEDYVYEDPYDSTETVEQQEPAPKRLSRHPIGCRCEYVVPELESRMDRMMEKMHFIETLAKTMISKEQSRPTERSQLTAAQAEIQQLRRQLSAAQRATQEY